MSDNGKREKAKWNGYVNYRPNGSEVTAIKANLLSADQVLNLHAMLAEDGYKVAYRHDDYRDAPVAEVYGYYADTKNPGSTLTVAHHDPIVAWSAVDFFLREVAVDGVWPSPKDLRTPYDW